MSEQSTLAVDKEIADKVRTVTKNVRARTKDDGTTTLDVTNQLLEYALEHAELDVEVRTIKVRPSDMLKEKNN